MPLMKHASSLFSAVMRSSSRSTTTMTDGSTSQQRSTGTSSDSGDGDVFEDKSASNSCSSADALHEDNSTSAKSQGYSDTAGKKAGDIDIVNDDAFENDMTKHGDRPKDARSHGQFVKPMMTFDLQSVMSTSPDENALRLEAIFDEPGKEAVESIRPSTDPGKNMLYSHVVSERSTTHTLGHRRSCGSPTRVVSILDAQPSVNQSLSLGRGVDILNLHPGLLSKWQNGPVADWEIDDEDFVSIAAKPTPNLKIFVAEKRHVSSTSVSLESEQTNQENTSDSTV